MDPGNSSSVFTDNGSGATTFEALAAGGSSTSVAAPTARHVEFRMSSGIERAHVDAYVVSAPGGTNACRMGTLIDEND